MPVRRQQLVDFGRRRRHHLRLCPPNWSPLEEAPLASHSGAAGRTDGLCELAGASGRPTNGLVARPVGELLSELRASNSGRSQPSRLVAAIVESQPADAVSRDHLRSFRRERACRRSTGARIESSSSKLFGRLTQFVRLPVIVMIIAAPAGARLSQSADSKTFPLSRPSFASRAALHGSVFARDARRLRAPSPLQVLAASFVCAGRAASGEQRAARVVSANSIVLAEHAAGLPRVSRAVLLRPQTSEVKNKRSTAGDSQRSDESAARRFVLRRPAARPPDKPRAAPRPAR